MLRLQTVQEVCRAYAEARQRFEEERRWIERGDRTTNNRVEEVRPIAIAWAELMIPAALRQKRHLKGRWSVHEREGGGFDVTLRPQLVSERVHLRALVLQDVKEARRNTREDAGGSLGYDVRIVGRLCRPRKEDWTCKRWQLLHSAYIECLSPASVPPDHTRRRSQFFDYALVAILAEPERISYSEKDETVRNLAERLGGEADHDAVIEDAETQLYQREAYEYNKAALNWSYLGALPARRYIPRPLPSGRRHIEALDDMHVFCLDVLRNARTRARRKHRGGRPLEVLRDWYIERAIAGLGAIGYRGYAACELVLEKVTGYRFATLRAMCDARRARAHKRDEDTEETLNRELEELLGYRRQVARDITDAVLLFPGRRDSIGQEAKDVLPSLRARIRKIEKALKAIRERRDT